MNLFSTDEAQRVYAELPLKERLFVRARRFTAPLEAVVERVPAGAVADIGCGHGALTSLLALGDPRRNVTGIDPDARKIAWAERGPGKLPNVRLEVGTVEDLAAKAAGTFDAAVVCDVLYLLPVERWGAFLATCARLLKPGGRLLLKEAEGDRSWKHFKCVAQEWVMVKLVGKTKSSGGLQLEPREYTEGLLRDAGLKLVETVDLSRGFTTPHVLFVAER
jgi:2-polyprenyl-6-hydroxyphenyl methylase/3-demethylubiquinone-9 3-methyltransferase